MSETSKEYDLGFQQTFQWLSVGSKGNQPVPSRSLSDYAADDWWAGSHSAFTYFVEASRLQDQLQAQVEDLIIHGIACSLLVLGIYLLVDCPPITKIIGVLVLILSYILFKSSRSEPQVNKG